VASVVGAVTTLVPGSKLIDLFFTFFGNPLKCDGSVVVDAIVYTNDTLNNMNQYQKNCTTKNYTYATSNILICGTANSTYVVTYCLERLDAMPVKGAAVANVQPSVAMSLVGLGSAMLYGVFELFV
jgi:hypothetical protein